jgi:alpha-1,3-rhamnosyltransferase
VSVNPRVSVCIPAYNQAPFLPSAIESVLAQTYRNLEIIIVDDGSVDGTLQIAETYAASRPEQISVFTHADNCNLGPSATVNRGLRESTGDYCCLLGSDDIFYPYKTEQQVKFLQRHPNVDMVHSTAQYMDANGNDLPVRLGQRTPPGMAGVEKLIQANRVADMTVMFKRSLLSKVGFHNDQLVYGDWEFWIRIAAQFRMAFINEPLVRYRIHNGNISVGNTDEVNFQRALQVISSLLENPYRVALFDTPRIKALINFQCARYLFCLDDFDAALARLNAGFEIYPDIDAALFTDWMRDVYLPRVKAQTLYRWLSDNLPEDLGNEFRRKVGNIFTGVAAGWATRESYERGDLRAAQKKAVEAIKADLHLLGDRQLLSIYGRTMFGPTWLRRMRSLKHVLTSRRRPDSEGRIGEVTEPKYELEG